MYSGSKKTTAKPFGAVATRKAGLIPKQRTSVKLNNPTSMPARPTGIKLNTPKSLPKRVVSGSPLNMGAIMGRRRGRLAR